MRESRVFPVPIRSGRAPRPHPALGLLREAEIRNALGRVIPNVRRRARADIGSAAFTRTCRSGKRVRARRRRIPIVFGVDHYVKFVVIVDDDIDVFDEADVLWAAGDPRAGRSRSRRDRREPRAILDPSGAPTA